MKNKFILALAVLAGCATQTTFHEGQMLLAEGRTEEGLARLEQAVQEEPGNAKVRAYLATQRERTLNRLLAEAMAARLNGQLDAAEAIYRRAERLDPKSRQVAAGLDGLAADRRHTALFAEAEDYFNQDKLDQARAALRKILAENPRQRQARQLLRRVEERQAGRDATAAPQVRTRLSRPITLEFRDADVRAIFEVISRSAGVNFIFDRDVRPDLKASIFVKNTSIDDAIKLLLMSNQLDRRVVNENTVLIYPNNPAKQRDYQELVVRSFYLTSADAKQTGNLMRSVLKIRDIFIDERINMLVVRDSPEAVRMAEKLVAAQDIPEPESVLEVEVLEVSAGRLQNLGIQWPEQVGYGLLQGGATTQATTGGVVVQTTTPGQSVASGVVDLHNRSGLTTFVANPMLLLNLRAQETSANVLANPRIRVKNKEKAKVHIGDRVPVITSTSTATGFVSQSITYLDVGVKLDVEPNVGLDDEVTMKVGLEVSNIVSQVTTSSGTVAFRVGTRSAGTTLRLKDGETQVLAGLIQDEDRRNASKVPGLGDLPLLGRLFSNHEDNHAKTEIVLLITPRIVRTLAFPEAGKLEFAAGTEASLGRGGGGGESGFPVGAAAEPIPSGAPPVPTTPQPEAGGTPLSPPTGPAPEPPR